jgi:acetyl-CoA acetyltransferase
MTPPLNAAVVGAAITPVGVWPEETSFGLAARALTAALEDAGLDRSDLDGFVWNLGRPSGEDYEAMLIALGLRARFVNQFWTHGRFTGSSLLVAAMAVTAGLADYVVCVGGTKRQPAPPPVASFAAPALPGDPQAYGPGDPRRHGLTTFVHHAAMSFQAYLALYGVDRDRLADVALAAREHAMRNETAWRREPLTLEEYLASPEIVSPLRALDCFPFGASGSPMNDYGACVIVTRADLAKSLPGTPAYILGGQGVQGGREESAYFGRPGLGLFDQTTSTFEPGEWDRKVYEHAGVEPSDVDAFYTYDAFAPVVWMALERFGHCAPGDAASWVTKERIGPGGSFQVNTNGGMLSQGHTGGWGHIVELTQQLRGNAGPRQIENVGVAQWGTVFGDSVILSNDERRWQR